LYTKEKQQNAFALHFYVYIFLLLVSSRHLNSITKAPERVSSTFFPMNFDAVLYECIG